MTRQRRFQVFRVRDTDTAHTGMWTGYCRACGTAIYRTTWDSAYAWPRTHAPNCVPVAGRRV